MNGFFKLWVALNTTPATFIQALIAMGIATVYALIKIALFGERADETSMIESIIVLIGSIVLAKIILQKISNRKK